jgi:hypothetical protein
MCERRPNPDVHRAPCKSTARLRSRASFALFGLARGACALAILASLGCETTCDPDGKAPQRFSGGTTNEARTSYESSTWDGPFLFFPSGRTYRLEHGLGQTPASYHVYLSFAEFPFRGSGVAESAGNQAIVEAINDEYVEVRNDTCAEYFLRLTATTSEAASMGSALEQSDSGAPLGTSDAAAQ